MGNRKSRSETKAKGIVDDLQQRLIPLLTDNSKEFERMLNTSVTNILSEFHADDVSADFEDQELYNRLLQGIHDMDECTHSQLEINLLHFLSTYQALSFAMEKARFCMKYTMQELHDVLRGQLPGYEMFLEVLTMDSVNAMLETTRRIMETKIRLLGDSYSDEFFTALEKMEAPENVKNDVNLLKKTMLTLLNEKLKLVEKDAKQIGESVALGAVRKVDYFSPSQKVRDPRQISAIIEMAVEEVKTTVGDQANTSFHIVVETGGLRPKCLNEDTRKRQLREMIMSANNMKTQVTKITITNNTRWPHHMSSKADPFSYQDAKILKEADSEIEEGETTFLYPLELCTDLMRSNIIKSSLHFPVVEINSSLQGFVQFLITGEIGLELRHTCRRPAAQKDMMVTYGVSVQDKHSKIHFYSAKRIKKRKKVLRKEGWEKTVRLGRADIPSQSHFPLEIEIVYSISWAEIPLEEDEV